MRKPSERYRRPRRHPALLRSRLVFAVVRAPHPDHCGHLLPARPWTRFIVPSGKEELRKMRNRVRIVMATNYRARSPTQRQLDSPKEVSCLAQLDSRS